MKKKAKSNSRYYYRMGIDHRHWCVSVRVNKDEIAHNRACISINVGLAFNNVCDLCAANISCHLGGNTLASTQTLPFQTN